MYDADNRFAASAARLSPSDADGNMLCDPARGTLTKAKTSRDATRTNNNCIRNRPLVPGILGLKGLRDLYRKTGDLGPGRGLGGILIFIIFGILLLFMGITGFGLKKKQLSHPERFRQQPVMTPSETPR